jgi:PAS domain S-box-containing protein
VTHGEPAERRWTLSDDQLTMLANTLDAVPSAIAFWNRELRNVFANRNAYLEWFGVSAEELRGEHARVLLGPELFELNRPYMLAALAGERQVFERVLDTPAGERRETQLEYTPYVSDGEILGFVTIMVDVSARVRVERSARVTAERLATLTERQRIEQRAHEGILQDLFAVQLNIERARAAVAAEREPVVTALETALDRLDAAVADLRLVLGVEQTLPPEDDGGAPARLSATLRA